jgi:hypothetical protein
MRPVEKTTSTANRTAVLKVSTAWACRWGGELHHRDQRLRNAGFRLGVVQCLGIAAIDEFEVRIGPGCGDQLHAYCIAVGHAERFKEQARER